MTAKTTSYARVERGRTANLVCNEVFYNGTSFTFEVIGRLSNDGSVTIFRQFPTRGEALDYMTRCESVLCESCDCADPTTDPNLAAECDCECHSPA